MPQAALLTLKSEIAESVTSIQKLMLAASCSILMALSQDTHLFKVIDEELGIKSLQRSASNEINL